VTVKDEDEFKYLQQEGLIDPDVAARVEAERLLVLEEIDSGSLYSPRWFSWRPDRQWGCPVLPADWDSIAD
jgi:hypothetical protein